MSKAFDELVKEKIGEDADPEKYAEVLSQGIPDLLMWAGHRLESIAPTIQETMFYSVLAHQIGENNVQTILAERMHAHIGQLKGVLFVLEETDKKINAIETTTVVVDSKTTEG